MTPWYFTEYGFSFLPFYAIVVEVKSKQEETNEKSK